MAPSVAFAALGGVQNLVVALSGIVNLLAPMFLALAVAVFFWGLVKYIANASDEAAKEGGKTLMIWGMIAIFIMVALWSILGWVQTTLELTGDIDTGATPNFSLPT
ncbi:MAG: hypothetical protein A3C93_05715 [Candidatus Lloydbacteria bacterium RIFCSPHIGHO2_02_FULL_54_17]|uniref:Uncharacterized protein n=1 Tax=Candidatus Lloydbacteria bacterium RIFCSPHIGHO2_02_FULL_54_17 TaxID=1798664 RepID=A0A1G2DCX1_9BACT|nr:MAG: hypothetical protein A3C93_05715 [Candidatus Lloydbacteria bacterium RIFCSPHIGHO2_02_FULL_54_17]